MHAATAWQYGQYETAMALLDELQLLDQLTFERRLKMEIAPW